MCVRARASVHACGRGHTTLVFYGTERAGRVRVSGLICPLCVFVVHVVLLVQVYACVCVIHSQRCLVSCAGVRVRVVLAGFSVSDPSKGLPLETGA